MLAGSSDTDDTDGEGVDEDEDEGVPIAPIERDPSNSKVKRGTSARAREQEARRAYIETCRKRREEQAERARMWKVAPSTLAAAAAGGAEASTNAGTRRVDGEAAPVTPVVGPPADSSGFDGSRPFVQTFRGYSAPERLSSRGTLHSLSQAADGDGDAAGSGSRPGLGLQIR